jgi:hypothetical protein
MKHLLSSDLGRFYDEWKAVNLEDLGAPSQTSVAQRILFSLLNGRLKRPTSRWSNDEEQAIE